MQHQSSQSVSEKERNTSSISPSACILSYARSLKGLKSSTASWFATNMDDINPTTEDYWSFGDYDNYTSPPDASRSRAIPCLQEDIYSFAQKYSPAVYSLVFVLAVLGNILVLCVIRRYRNSQSGGACAFSLTDTFLLHLAISDLLLAFTLPLFAVQWNKEWVFGEAACKISSALFTLNRYSGILFLACISFDRYLAIVHAVSSGWKRNTCHAQIACAVIWVCCLGLSGVDITFKQVDGVMMKDNKQVLLCRLQFDENSTQWWVGLQMVNVILGFGFPLLIMLYCYIRIFRSLCNATRRQKRKSLRLIVSLVSVFVICWAPFNCFQLVDSLHRLGLVSGGCQFGRIVDTGTLITESMGLTHCALNPLLYGFVGVKFRRELARMCKGLLGQRGWLGMEEWREKRNRKPRGSCSSAESENTSYSVMINMDVELDGLFLQNSTYNYEDYEYPEDFGSRGSTAVVIPVLYSLVMVVGLFGNGLLLAILALKRRFWTLSDTIILHLSITDVLLLLTLPLWAVQAAQHRGWCFGGFLCKFSGAVFNINFYCGILLLLCITLDRYLSTVHGIQLYSQTKLRLVHISCLLVWLISLILTIPDWIFMVTEKGQAEEKTQCHHDYSPSDQKLVSRLPHHMLGFLLPAAALIICCSCILVRLQRSPKVLQTQRAFVVTILPLMAVFFLCWMPYNVTLILHTTRSSSKELNGVPADSTNDALQTALIATKALGCIHACLRPLLYLGLCGNFRKRALTVLRCAKVEQEDSLWELGVGKEAPPEQSHDESEELKQMTTVDHQVQSTHC
ncbi:C-X-C chemokine receptor type 3-2 [Notolabrus celidotus]|uniref:C-X-C chemokine receptor type 3-2 n=1 Tax=Notolabrus celidotus TaxID=1203425 RepID=UPI00149064B7|nr:C-X-C chemokine receptor type 3-2 [Notolabrus celidotus]